MLDNIVDKSSMRIATILNLLYSAEEVDNNIH